jgi:hypothetical protein
MGKKRAIFLFSIILISVFSVTAFAKVGLELRGGLALINPEEYNNGLLYANPLFNDHGFSNAFFRLYNGNNPAWTNLTLDTAAADFMGSSISQMLNGSALVSVFLGDSFAIKLRGEGIYCDYDDIITIDGVDALYSHTILVTAYFGAGLAYYFNLSPNLAFFLSADGGMFMNMDSFYEVGSFADAGTVLAGLDLPQGAYSVDFNESFFGGHGEAGVQLLLSESVGVSLFGGYRYGVMPVTFPNAGAVTLVDSAGNSTFTKAGVFTATAIDISGVYFGGGLVFYFGADQLAASGAPATAAASTGAAPAKSKYEQYGDIFFKKKDYKSALAYYNGAYKLAPNAGLMKKMGFCYYYMKNNAKALEYLQKYLQANPNDEAIKKWVAPLLKQ